MTLGKRQKWSPYPSFHTIVRLSRLWTPKTREANNMTRTKQHIHHSEIPVSQFLLSAPAANTPITALALRQLRLPVNSPTVPEHV